MWIDGAVNAEWDTLECNKMQKSFGVLWSKAETENLNITPQSVWVSPLCFNLPVTDEALLALHSLFGKPLEKALELLETNCVVYLRATGGRCVVQVTGSSGIPYTLFPGVNYCPCPAYRYQVISGQIFLTCKHVLAARLAEITQKGRNLSVSVEELTRILCAAANLDRDGVNNEPNPTYLV